MSGINVRSFALTTGIFGGFSMFFIAWWLILIGAVWGFVDWGIAGAIFAWLYNWLSKKLG